MKDCMKHAHLSALDDTQRKVLLDLGAKVRDKFGADPPRRFVSITLRALSVRLGISLYKCKKFVFASAGEDFQRKIMKKRVLKQKHIDFLTAEATLARWRGYSLRDRIRLFETRFGHSKKLSYRRLRKIYADARIK